MDVEEETSEKSQGPGSEKAKDTQLTILEDLAQPPMRNQEESDEPKLAAPVPVTVIQASP